ncbi:MAG TPA: CaiB/BaiF CoA-transferase family protein [Rugosibacter sp.]
MRPKEVQSRPKKVQSRPLEGITVVTLEHAIAAPFATRQLADLGARVIKIERPGSGDFARGYDQRTRGMASHFVWTNRSKESLTLDVKHPLANDVLHRLLAEADVLVQNLAPGAAARLGLSYEVLEKTYPRLIVCDISGYGDNGPYTNKKAYDLLIQSEAGFLSITGTPETPCKAGNSAADIAAGMYAYSGILAALIERGKTGKGRRIEISMLEAMAEWMSYPLYYSIDDQPPPGRTGAAHATIYPYGPFKAGAGLNPPTNETVMLGLQNEREWIVFCQQVLLRPDLATDERFAGNAQRQTNRQMLAAIIDEVFAQLDGAMLVDRLDKAEIANARVNDMAALWRHPQLAARDRWRTIDSPVGPLPALLPPAASASDEPRMDAVPALGEHTQAILAELGFNVCEIQQLQAEGAI